MNQEQHNVNHIHLESANEIIRALSSALDLPQLEEVEIIAHEDYQLPANFFTIPFSQEVQYSDNETVFINVQEPVQPSTSSQVCQKVHSESL